MNLASRITALLTSLTPSKVRTMAPCERRALANECLRVLQLAMAAPEVPKEGVLSDLSDPRGRH
ncbi:MAG: hypothetical protein J2P50_06850 [Hyphomicrobiaceae bacterium]|nr:hypothetical protein [Hyphomicrobiaceae bacterium]